VGLGGIGRLNQIARRLFRRGKDRGGGVEAESAVAGPEKPSPLDDRCRPAVWLVLEGFERGLAGIELEASARERLCAAFVEAVRSGSAGAEEAVVAAQLAGVDWRWPELRRWEALFAQRRQWPSLWQGCPSLTALRHPPPANLSEALPYFGYLELRDILNTRSVERKPAPIRVEELTQSFLANVSWEEISPLALEKHRLFVERSLAGRDGDRCRLLAHHLRATVHNLIPYHQGLAVQAHGLLKYRWEVTPPGDEPWAADFAESFNRGESSRIPPYFPGDRCRLRLVRD